ncbi:uncharacterized protein LOC144623829 isoform X2 [Crassostrea virginica]
MGCGAVSVCSDVANEGGLGITEEFLADFLHSLVLSAFGMLRWCRRLVLLAGRGSFPGTSTGDCCTSRHPQQPPTWPALLGRPWIIMKSCRLWWQILTVIPAQRMTKCQNFLSLEVHIKSWPTGYNSQKFLLI